jgi:hypothetical protein
MKKLFVILLTLFGVSGHSNAEVEVNLSCSFDYAYFFSDGKETELRPEFNSLVIFPNSQEYIYESVKSTYILKGNKIEFTLFIAGLNIKKIYTLDKTTSVFKEHIYFRDDKDNKYKYKGIFTGKCNKSKSLF